MIQPFPDEPSGTTQTAIDAERLQRKPSREEYGSLVKQKTPEPRSRPESPRAEPRRLSLMSQHRNTADQKTHPSRNFHLPHLATKDAAHAEKLLSIYCGRLCAWGLATFEATSSEARLLHELQALDYLMQASALSRTVDPSAYETEAHASSVLALTREAMHAKEHVTAFRLSFEVDQHLYDIIEVVQCLHHAAVSTLLGLFLST